MPQRIALWIFVALVLSVGVVPNSGWAQGDPPPAEGAAGGAEKDAGNADAEESSPARLARLDSPQALFETFISSWNRATFKNDKVERKLENINTDERRRELLKAIQCLETGISATEVTPVLYRQARDLIDVLNLDRRVDTDALPPAPGPATGRYNYNLTAVSNSIPIVEIDDRWVFEGSWIQMQLGGILASMNILGLEEYEAFSVRRYVPEVLRQRALFLEHWQWIGIATLLILAWLVHRIVIFVTRGLISGWISRHPRGQSTGDAIRAMSVSVGFFASAALIWLLHPHLELQATGTKILIVLAKIVASIGGMLLAYRIADLAGARLRDAAEKTDSKLDDQLAPMLERSLKVLITVGAVLFVLDNLDVDILSFLAGLGVVGIGVGLAAKDTFANLFGSVTVFADKPFQVGDWIVVGSVEGTVEEIGFRTTRIRTFYNSVIALPNSKLVDSAIDNMGVRRWRRYVTRLGLLYSTPATRIEAFCEGINQIVRANERMRQDYYHVYLNDFGDSALEVLVYVFFDVADWGQELHARQDFMLEVIRLAEHLEVGFAFPTTSIHIESTPENPLSMPAARPDAELRTEVERFGPKGNLSRPDGSASFPR